MLRITKNIALAMVISSAVMSAPVFAASAQKGISSQSVEYLTVEQLRKAYADPNGKIVNIHGVDIYFKDEGPRSEQAILMVHGSQSSLRTWDHITPALKSKHRVIRYDVPAMGLSGDVSDVAAATVTPVDIAKGLLDHLGVKRIVFVGVSSGGTLGALLAAKHPELVDSLILSNMPSDPVRSDHMVQPESFKQAQAEAQRQNGFKSENFWSEFLSYFYGDPRRLSQAKIKEYYDFNRRVPNKNELALVAKVGDGTVSTQAMNGIKAPILLVWGAKDQLLPLSAMQSLSRKLENAPVSKLIIPDVGHYPPVEAPERFYEIIRTYVDVVLKAD